MVYYLEIFAWLLAGLPFALIGTWFSVGAELLS